MKIEVMYNKDENKKVARNLVGVYEEYINDEPEYNDDGSIYYQSILDEKLFTITVKPLYDSFRNDIDWNDNYDWNDITIEVF